MPIAMGINILYTQYKKDGFRVVVGADDRSWNIAQLDNFRKILDKNCFI
jgi:hypothetical protein